MKGEKVNKLHPVCSLSPGGIYMEKPPSYTWLNCCTSSEQAVVLNAKCESLLKDMLSYLKHHM